MLSTSSSSRSNPPGSSGGNRPGTSGTSSNNQPGTSGIGTQPGTSGAITSGQPGTSGASTSGQRRTSSFGSCNKPGTSGTSTSHRPHSSSSSASSSTSGYSNRPGTSGAGKSFANSSNRASASGSGSRKGPGSSKGTSSKSSSSRASFSGASTSGAGSSKAGTSSNRPRWPIKSSGSSSVKSRAGPVPSSRVGPAFYGVQRSASVQHLGPAHSTGSVYTQGPSVPLQRDPRDMVLFSNQRRRLRRSLSRTSMLFSDRFSTGRACAQQAVKQLRDIQRRGSSPDVSGLTGSPRHHHRRSGGGVPPLEQEDPHNGDLGDISLLSRERDLLERQVSELEHRLTEAGNSLADSEHETRQLREHVSRQEDDLRQNQRLLQHTETENEDLRKRLTLVKRQLRSSDSERGAAGAASVGSQGNSLNSSLTSSFDQGPFTSRSSSGGGGGEGSMLGGELQNVLLTSVNLGSEMKELKSIVQKQRDIILMLIKRQNCEKDNMKRRAEMQQRAEPQTCGIGARPKVRSAGLAASNVPSAASGGGGSLPPSGSRGQLIQPVACTEDLLAQENIASSRGAPLHKDMRRSPLHQQRTRGPGDRFSAPAVLVEPGSSGHSSTPATHTTRAAVGGGPGMEHDLDMPYDDLQFGGGVSVPWEQGTGGESNTEDMEPLLPSPPGQLGRNESMEHLHDDSPPYDSVGDLNSETSGSTLCGTDPEQEYDALEDASYRSVSSSTSEIENRYRGRSSPRHQQRSLNIDRNDHRGLTAPGGVKPRSYDNVSQNVNLATTPQDKYAPKPDANTTGGGGVGVGAGGGAATMNNNPLLQPHKPISQRNLYPPAPAPGQTRLSPEPTPPPRRSGRTPVEQASGEDLAVVAPELRNCPVCNEDFPSLMAMDEFQKHVLECPGRTERICPMCNAAFPDEVSQDQFERHVNEHFEDDTTLQFEVLQS